MELKAKAVEAAEATTAKGRTTEAVEIRGRRRRSSNEAPRA